jgi:hypothetical protein
MLFRFTLVHDLIGFYVCKERLVQCNCFQMIALVSLKEASPLRFVAKIQMQFFTRTQRCPEIDAWAGCLDSPATHTDQTGTRLS